MKRTNLFKIQGLLSVILVTLATCYHGFYTESLDLFKVVLAPFCAISLLIFGFFIYNKRRDLVDNDEAYGIRSILISLVWALVSGGVVTAALTMLGRVSDSLEHLIFGGAILIATIFFIFEKLRSLNTMALLTGIAQGTVILLLFF
ncbi:MAG: hypothetical protein AAF226_01335 [Verrucomicrobiota bacterium]